MIGLPQRNSRWLKVFRRYKMSSPQLSPWFVMPLIALGCTDHEAAKSWLRGEVNDSAKSVQIAFLDGKRVTLTPQGVSEINSLIGSKRGLKQFVPLVGKMGTATVTTQSGTVYKFSCYPEPTFFALFEGNDDYTNATTATFLPNDFSPDVFEQLKGDAGTAKY